jgi:uncharacterized coiled-coil DUF342 family protein
MTPRELQKLHRKCNRLLGKIINYQKSIDAIHKKMEITETVTELNNINDELDYFNNEIRLKWVLYNDVKQKIIKG